MAHIAVYERNGKKNMKIKGVKKATFNDKKIKVSFLIEGGATIDVTLEFEDSGQQLLQSVDSLCHELIKEFKRQTRK